MLNLIDLCIHNTDLQYIYNCCCFPIPVPMMGYPGVLVRCEQTGCVRNLSKKKIGESQHLLSL